MSFSVKVTGFGKIKKQLILISKNVREEVLKELIKGGLDIEATVKKSIASSPKDSDTGRSRPGNPPSTQTGRLISSYTTEVDRAKLEVSVGSNVEYAPFLEFGTRFMDARPVLGPAYDKHIDDIKRDVATAIKRGIRKALAG